MKKPNLKLIDSLKFQDKIKINGITLFRANSPADIDQKETYWEYEFYEKWDKNKNLLPKTSHIVRIYSNFQTTTKKGLKTIETKSYKKATILDLINKKEQEIIKIEK